MPYYSERQTGIKKQPNFSVIKTLIFKVFHDYLYAKDYMNYPKYKENDLTAFFLQRTYDSKLTPVNFNEGVLNDENLFDMIEVAIDFLNNEFKKSYHYHRSEWGNAEIGRFINSVDEILHKYWFRIWHGVVEKLPDNGMDWIVDNQISSQEPEKIEHKINEAKRLFLSREANIETKKSACAKLADVVDAFRPEIRVNLKEKTSLGGFCDYTEKLMWVVNNYDIRHNWKDVIVLKSWNKDDENFVEWTFYGLLNCINFYFKSYHK